MAVWCRIRQFQLKSLSNQFMRCYFQIPGPCLMNHTASHTRNLVLDKPSGLYHGSQFDFCNNVRFFAAPVQVKPKQEVKEPSGPRLNEQITAQYIRLVTDEGHDVVSRNEALERAKRLKIDLVEVDRNAKPPVCKLMDYHREKYNRRVIEKERTKGKSELILKKGVVKDVRFTFKIEEKDLQIKADTAKRLMERGYRVKCMATGTEEQDLGGLLSRLVAMIEDVSVVESGPKVEKKQAYVVVRHAKFGPSKKGTKKPDKIVVPTGANVENSTVSPQTLDSASEEDGVLSEEDKESTEVVLDKNNKSTWSISDATDDFDKVFNFNNDASKGSGPPPVHGFTKTPPVTPPVHGFTKTPPVHGFTKTPPASPPVSENRYKRVSQTNRTNVNGPNPNAARDSMRSGPGLGAFSNTETSNTPERQSGPAVVNRYKKVVPNNTNPPESNFQGNRRPDIGRWGGVRSDNSNVTPNRNAESHAKFNR